MDQIWHILSVTPNSPADTAGLLPYSDYIVGTPEGHVYGEAGLGELVEEYISRQLRLWVYNHEYAVTRLVTIMPSRSWGGEGALGCVLGFGALHRLPAPLSEGPIEGPGEALFEGVRLSGEQGRTLAGDVSPPKDGTGSEIAAQHKSSNMLVPALLPSLPPLQQPTSTPTSGPPKSGRRAKKTTSPNLAFDEYFKEGEQKSKEEDFAPSAKAAPPPPPPGGKNAPTGSNDADGEESEGKAP